MKKIILASMACLLSLGMVGCGNSDADKADKLIQSLQEYDKLSADEKKAFQDKFEYEFLSLPPQEQHRVRKAMYKDITPASIKKASDEYAERMGRVWRANGTVWGQDPEKVNK